VPWSGRTDSSRTPESLEYERRIVHAIRQLMRAVETHSRRLASERGVTMAQLFCLRAVARTGKSTASEIAKQVELSPSTVVGILDRLERAGLISRERDANDRRIVNVWLTPDGAQLVEETPGLFETVLTESLFETTDQELLDMALQIEALVTLMAAEGPAASEATNERIGAGAQEQDDGEPSAM
jgi:DNA-binding MarR family transcriptional regulator